MRSFYWRCFKLAFSGAWGVLGIATTIAGVVLAAIADKRPEWANPALISRVNSLGGWIVPLALFSSVLLARLIVAPFWIYEESVAKLRKFGAKRPRIVCVPHESATEPKITYDQAGQIVARININLHLVNRGDGEAHNYKLAVYSCWFKEPDNIDKWADEFFAKWPPGDVVEYRFAAQKRAEDQGGGRVGFTTMDELVFLIEIEAHANTPDGPDYKEEIWLSWEARQVDRMAPPNPSMVDAIRPHIEQFKKSLP